MNRTVSASVVALGCLVAAAGAAVVAVVVVPVEPAQVLRPPSTSSVVPVTHREDADERQVQLALETGGPREVVTSGSGTVTALHCTTGGVLRSGDVVAAVDGLPVVSIATATPLYRDIAEGDRGADVRAMQAEIARLGTPVVIDGLAGPGTIRAVRSFLLQRGVERTAIPDGVVPREPFAWLPAGEVAVRRCAGVVGAPVPDGGVLVELPAELRSARLERVPSGARPGNRAVTIGSAAVRVDGDGVVTAPEDLRSIGALPDYRAAVASAEGTPTIAGTWALVEPLAVDVVPPDALWDVADGAACVQPARGAPRRVEVVGSELGQSFVRTDTSVRLDRVRTDPDRTRGCR